MANEIWQEEEKKFLRANKNVKIPNFQLENVALVIPKSQANLDIIPSGGGCYWIWTNEPVLHSLHKNKTPRRFDNGEIIYNGIAKDNVKGRVSHHLFGQVDAGWSGISMDIFFNKTVSHRKKAMGIKGKVPFIKTSVIAKGGNKKSGINNGDTLEKFQALRTKEDLLKIHLSNIEIQYIINSKNDNIFFRNGIDITEPKHSGNEFRIYYITGLSSLYLDFIEKKWRKENGLPKLCSYSSGR